MQNKVLHTKLNMELEVIELCSGIGQTSLGLERACKKLGIDMKINAYCEIDEFASKGYELLHGKNIPNLGDITKASFKGRRCDVLLATTPCTSISRIGTKSGFSEDSGTASSIIWSVFRIIKELDEKPKIIFFENVKAMVEKDNIENLNKLIKRLGRLGYKVQYKVINALDHNIPQARMRVYIIATLNSSNIYFDFPKKEPLRVLLKDILEVNPSPKYLVPTIENYINGAMQRGYTFRVHNPSTSKYSFTLTTKSRGQNNNNYVFACDVDGDEVIRFTPNSGSKLNKFKKLPIRSLTRLEQGRLMGMRDYEIHKLDCVSDTQFSKQMGNGVVINVVEKIFKNVLEALIEVEVNINEQVA